MTTSWMALVIALWVVVVVLIALVLGLSRRVRELSNTLVSPPAGRGDAQASIRGPKLGSTIALAPVGASPLSTESRGETRDRVVLFLSASCGPCHALGDAIVAARDDGFVFDGAALVLVTDVLGADFYRSVGADDILVQPANEISRRLGINAIPYGVAVDASGVVRWSGVARRLDDVRSMVAALSIGAMVR